MSENHSETHPVCSAVVGLQWGDEGKGKVVDLLAATHDVVARYNGGANAGHSVVVQGQRFSLHLIPSGILYPSKLAVIGNGVVLDPDKLGQELDGLRARGVDTSGLIVSDRAHVVMPYHKAEDAAREDSLKSAREEAQAGSVSEIGTTRRGIGPAYAEKVQRAGAVRVGDLLRPESLKEKIGVAVATRRTSGLKLDPATLDEAKLLEWAIGAGELIRPMVQDTAYLLNNLVRAGKRILFESANGTLLDVDHGTYPFVTGSSCAIAGIGTGTGVPVQRVGRVVGVMKAYSTRVGAGPLPTELAGPGEAGAIGDRIRNRGREFGTTTGRPRRVGWLDLVAVRYSVMVNGITSIALTMLDVLAGMETVRVCTGYRVGGKVTDRFLPDAVSLGRAEPVYENLPGFADEIGAARIRRELPDRARAYVEFIESRVGVPVEIVSVGPDREQTITS
ncbi:MAG: adenylosuccinate synthase [Phycisphaerales bacterium]|nr:adenylosuccinate synthase [Planctomycetota bacterium]